MRTNVAVRSWVGALLVAVAVGCTVPIYTVESHPTPASARNLSTERMQRAIMLAGQRYQWQMSPVDAQTLHATHTNKQHSATVEIRYTAQSYSIKLVNSTALKQTSTQIHHAYNIWIRNLEAEIDLRLSEAAMAS